MRLRFPPRSSQREILGSVPGSHLKPRRGKRRVWGDLHMESKRRWPGQAREKMRRSGRNRHTMAQTRAEKARVWPIHLVVSSSGTTQRARGLSTMSGRREKKARSTYAPGPLGKDSPPLENPQRWYPKKLNPTWPNTNKVHSPRDCGPVHPLGFLPRALKPRSLTTPHYFGLSSLDCPRSLSEGGLAATGRVELGK